MRECLGFSRDFECDVDLHPGIKEIIGECRWAKLMVVNPLSHIRQSVNQAFVVKDAHLCNLHDPSPDLPPTPQRTHYRVMGFHTPSGGFFTSAWSRKQSWQSLVKRGHLR